MNLMGLRRQLAWHFHQKRVAACQWHEPMKNDDIIAAGTNPRDAMAYQPSAADIARVADLNQQEKTTSLSPEETAELDCYLQLEHMMPLAKARPRTCLDHE